MNKQRRSQLEKFHAQLDEIKAGIEALTEEEQEALDNMPENLQGTEKYETMENCISIMEEASLDIENVMDNLSEIFN